MRERILIGAESGAGKTYSWLSVARYNPDSQFYVAEPDDGVAKILELEYPDVKAKGNVHGSTRDAEGLWIQPNFISIWKDFSGFCNDIRKLKAESLINEDDWVVVEGLDIITQLIRSEYIADTNKIDRKTKELLEDPWEAIKVKRARDAPVLEPSDHDAINMEYERQMTFLAYATGCNFLGTSGISLIHFDSKFADKGQKEMYASLGTPYKVEGHKRNPRMFDTLVYLYSGIQYEMEVLKDRGIGKQSRVKNTEFYLSLEASRSKLNNSRS